MKAISQLKALVKRQLKKLYFGPVSRYLREKHIGRKFASHEKIKVAFYCDFGSEWIALEGVYLCLREDERFETVLLAVPQMEGGRVVGDKISAFFERLHYPYVKVYDEQSQSWIAPIDADYVFYTTHYVYRQAPSLSYKVMRKNARMCYIPYGTCVEAGKIGELLYGFEEMQYYDIVFAENEITKQIFQEYRDRDHAGHVRIETVGSPKYAAVRSLTPEEAPGYQQVVLYGPRWNTGEGNCSFFDLYPDLFENIQKNPDTLFIFRPHPLMADAFGKEWGKENWDEFVRKFNSYENTLFDNDPSYLPSFQKATVFVSDFSSLPYEFILTGKAVAYMDKGTPLNAFGENVARGFYRCRTGAELWTLLQELKAGKDPLEALRAEVVDTQYALSDEHVATRVRDVILRDHRALSAPGGGN